MLGWLLAFFRAWFAIKADIHDKEQQEVGAEKQVVKQDEAVIKDAYDSKKIEDAVFSQPDGAANDWLHKHQPKSGE